MGPGTDPHLFRPTRDDVAKLLAADVVFYNGLNLEGKMSDTLVKVASSGKRVFAVTELIDDKYLLEPPDFGGHYDPHVWMDVGGWVKATDAVIAKLAGQQMSDTLAMATEYDWHRDAGWDPFAKVHGLV